MLAALLAAAALAGPAAPAAPAAPAPVQLGDARLAGQRIVAGFAGETPPADLISRIRSGRLAGVFLNSYNFDSRREARRLVRRLRSVPRPRGLRSPLLVMLDQEGGLVKRLPGPPGRSAAQMGRAGTRACRREGAATGRMLRRTRINVDLAPVLDVARAGSAIEAEQRSFGRRPGRVGRCGAAFAGGLRRHGVAPTAKHFPGLGAARLNTDVASQRIGLSKRRLRHHDEAPYRRYIRGGAPGTLVMVSSAIYPAFSGRPAAFTARLATAELRRRLGFEGVSITDALGTASTRAFGGTPKVARAAAGAGTDLLLFTSLGPAKRAAEALRGMLSHAGRQGRRRFAESVERVLELRAGLARRP